MGSSTNLLQDIKIRKSIPKEANYFLNDGGGLSLFVKIDGTKQWIFKYTSPITKKQRKTSFKTYPEMSLINARAKRDEFLDLLARGIDPINNAQNEKSEAIREIKGVFKDVVNEWLEKESNETKEITHKRKIALFENDVLPFVKNKHIRDVSIDDIILIINQKKIKAQETASRLFNYLDNLFRYGVLKRYCDRNLLSDIRKSDIIKSRVAKHYPKITDIEILKELVNAIYNYKGGHSLKNALILVLHIPLRAENLCFLKWEYINFEKKVLTIPRELMKIKNINVDDFKLPLTDEVINILNEQKTILTKYSELKEFVFLGTDNKSPINKESPNRALERLGFNDEKRGRRIRLHGFRGTFRSMIDTLDIDNKFSFEVKERALDHHEKNQVARAYNHRANYFEQLKPLMSYWSDFILSLKDGVR